MNKVQNDSPDYSILSAIGSGLSKYIPFAVALELELFTTIDQGSHTLDEIARASQCARHSVHLLLDALRALQLVQKAGDGYNLSPTAETFLVRGKPTYMGDVFLREAYAASDRKQLAEAVKTGEGSTGNLTGTSAAEIWKPGSEVSFFYLEQNVEKALEMWNILDADGLVASDIQVLDAACGSGIWTFVLAQKHPAVRITALDHQDILDVAIRVAREMKVVEQIDFTSGDILTADFGDECFDMIYFGNILFYFSVERLLGILRRTCRALKPGGLAVINNPLRSEKEEDSLEPLAKRFYNFCNSGGDFYSFSDFKGILEEAGFGNIKMHTSSLLSAKR